MYRHYYGINARGNLTSIFKSKNFICFSIGSPRLNWAGLGLLATNKYGTA